VSTRVCWGPEPRSPRSLVINGPVTFKGGTFKGGTSEAVTVKVDTLEAVSSHNLPIKKIAPTISGACTGFLQDRGTLEKRILALLDVAPHLLHSDPCTYRDLKVLWDVKLKCFRQMEELLESRSIHDAMLAAELGGLVALLGCVLFRTSEDSYDDIAKLNASFEKSSEGGKHAEKQGRAESGGFLLRESLRDQVQTPRVAESGPCLTWSQHT